MFSLHWFRYDLRIKDNQSFFNSLSSDKNILIYIFDEDIIKSNTYSSFHHSFIIDSLNDLEGDLLKNFNAPLNIYYGKSLDIFKFLIDKYPIDKVHSNKVYRGESFMEIDSNCLNFFKSKGVEWNITNQFGIQLENRNRSTWSLDWKKFMSSKLYQPTKTNCSFLKDYKIQMSNLVLPNLLDGDIQKGGTHQAMNLVDSFLSKRGEKYQSQMSSPITAESSCSRLSPHIAYGTISLREIFQITVHHQNQDITTDKKKSLRSFKSRLAWHCHFIQKFYDQPSIEKYNLSSSYDGLRENDFNERYFSAWKDGMTGYPFIDACMRYLKNNGWINFRMRAMLVSFASYQLWLDWKLTSKFLSKYFTDYEPGIHYSQFQMQSGTTGINTLRIYNPIKQSYDHDALGCFIKKWVPELSNVPIKYIHEPWTMTPIESKCLNFKIGKSYKDRIIDNKLSTRLAKEKIWAVKKSLNAREEAKEIVKRHASMKRGR